MKQANEEYILAVHRASELTRSYTCLLYLGRPRKLARADMRSVANHAGRTRNNQGRGGLSACRADGLSMMYVDTGPVHRCVTCMPETGVMGRGAAGRGRSAPIWSRWFTFQPCAAQTRKPLHLLFPLSSSSPALSCASEPDTRPLISLSWLREPKTLIKASTRICPTSI